MVDSWKVAKAPAATDARLITLDKVKNLGYEWGLRGVSEEGRIKAEDTPTWLYNENYEYWTISQYNDSASCVWLVINDGRITGSGVYYDDTVVRPVIVIPKSVL